MFEFLYCCVIILGFITTLLLLIYICLCIIYVVRKKELPLPDTLVNMKAMPVMRPTPIPTANQQGFLNKILIFVFQVRRWRIEDAFIYEYCGNRYAIHAGFEFDGASIPRPLWAILSPIGLLLIPGLIHDYGYRYNGIYILDKDNNPIWDESINSKSGWDELFKNIGDHVNRIPVLNLLAKIGLLLGGYSAWNKWRDAESAQEPFVWKLGDSHKQENKPEKAKESTHHDKNEQSDIINEIVCDVEFESGKTKTTKIDYVNSNNQKVHGTRNIKETDHNKVSYKLECLDCNELYGAIGTEIFRRKCPNCQGGKPGIRY